jgi:hypothetical protein
LRIVIHKNPQGSEKNQSRLNSEWNAPGVRIAPASLQAEITPLKPAILIKDKRL